MKYCRFSYNGEVSYGLKDDYDDKLKRIEGNIFDDFALTSRFLSEGEITYLPPCVPTKIVVIGLNYRDHIAEAGLPVPDEPYIVTRPLNTLNAHGGDVFLKEPQHLIQFEGELAVIMGKKAKNVIEGDAQKYILGYSCANDITDRTLFKKDGHFGRAKAYDLYCPVGPYVETDPAMGDLEIITQVNGVVRQQGHTGNMVFSVPYLISYLSCFMTLYPGDVILTGSPAGTGPLNPGDEVDVTISSVGTLSNKVYSEIPNAE